MTTNPAVSPPSGSPLRARLRVYAAVALAILGACLYYTVNAVLGLYGVTVTIERSTDLRQRVIDAQTALHEAEDSLQQYVTGGQGYDLARHRTSRTSLRTALGAIRQRSLSAVFLDLVMPPPDGFDVLSRIRQAPAFRDVPVIIVTAKELTPEETERLNGSAQRVLRKGQDLRQLVREVLTTIEVAPMAASTPRELS
jgi:CheY-like chemotaxis protein